MSEYTPRGEPQIDSHGVVHATNAWGDPVPWCVYTHHVPIDAERCRSAPGRAFTCLWCAARFR